MMHKFFFTTIVCLAFTFQSYAQFPFNNPFIDFYRGKGVEKNQISSVVSYPYSGLGTSTLIKNVPIIITNGNYINNTYCPVSMGYQNLYGSLFIPFKFQYQKSHEIALFINNYAQFDLNYSGKFKIKDSLSTDILLNGNIGKQKVDINKDVFLDIPLKEKYFISNHWEKIGKKINTNFRLTYFKLDELAGQSSFDKAKDYLTTNIYGYGTNTSHLSGFYTNQIKFTRRKKLYLHLQGSSYQQKSFFGLRKYKGDESLLIGNLFFENERLMGKYTAGVSYKWNKTAESIDSISLSRNESMIGAYGEHELYWGNFLRTKAQMRIDYHNLFKWIYTPLFKADISIIKNLKTTFFTGKAFRYSNIFAENLPYFISSRKIEVSESIKPEKGWYYGAGLETNINISYSLYATIKSYYKRTDLQNAIVTDLDQDASKIFFYNLKGQAYINSFESSLDLRILRSKIHANILYRHEQPRVTINDTLRQLPLYAKNRMFVEIAYALTFNSYSSYRYTKRIIFSAQTAITGRQRLPKTSLNTPTQSPAFAQYDLKVTFPFSGWVSDSNYFKHASIIVGVNNITNMRQKNPFILSSQPFSSGFDGGSIWGPMVGRNFFIGVKLEY